MDNLPNELRRKETVQEKWCGDSLAVAPMALQKVAGKWGVEEVKRIGKEISSF